MPDSRPDVLVIGAGPAGLYCAERFARAGAQVLVCEEHDRVGDPVHCTGILAAESFAELDLPREPLLNALTHVRFVSPSGVGVPYSTPSPLAVVIDRPAFDRALAARACAAGAELRTGARVSALDVDRHGVRAAVGDRFVEARLVVVACGATYAVQRRFGLGLPRAYLQTAQRELPASCPGDVELHFGHEVAPGGFAWAVPVARPDGSSSVRIGVMTTHEAPAAYARMLTRVAGRWGIEPDGPPRQKILPLGTIDRTYADRVLVVGDAAGLVKPTTGGGIYYSIVSGALAAEVGVKALACDRLDVGALAEYERRWRAQLDDEFAAQHALRDVVTRLSDAEIDSFFELARTDGIMPLVRSTARFNRHRDLIVALFRHPPARRLLFRALGR